MLTVARYLLAVLAGIAANEAGFRPFTPAGAVTVVLLAAYAVLTLETARRQLNRARAEGVVQGVSLAIRWAVEQSKKEKK